MTTMRASLDDQRRGCWSGIDLVFAVVGLWLGGTSAIAYMGGSYDDLLYLKLAGSIMHGAWLGSYDQLTLARGPAFPLFLAAATLAGIPMTVAAQAIYLLGSYALAMFVGNAVGSRMARSALFGLLALNPVLYAGALLFVMRENLYIGLSILLIAVAVRCLPPLRDRGRPGAATLAAAAATGVVFGAFWQTREEGIWMLPPLAIIFGARLVAAVVDFRRVRHRPSPGRMVCEGLVFCLPVAGFLAVVVPVAAINHAYYGVFRTNDFQQGPFPKAYGAFLRVKPAQHRQYFLMPRDVRAAIYRVSPAARELQPFLEGPLGQFWIAQGCQQSKVPDCTDLQGGWSMFVLRGAMTDAGYYTSAAESDRFLRRLASEIDAACDDGRLSCTSARSGMLPPLGPGVLTQILRSAMQVGKYTLLLSGSDPGYEVDDASIWDLAVSRRINAGLAAPTRSSMQGPAVLLEGWIARPPARAGMTLRMTADAGQSGSIASAAFMAKNDPAVAMAIGHPEDVVSRFQSSCRPGCRLLVTLDNAVLFEAGVGSLRPGRIVLPGGAALNIDAVLREPEAGMPQRFPLRVATLIAHIVRGFARAAILVAGAALACLLVRDIRRRHTTRVNLAAYVLLGALISRTAIIAVGDATTTPALGFRFLAPGMCLYLALVGVSLAAFWAEFVEPGHRRGEGRRVDGARQSKPGAFAPGRASRRW